MENKSKQSTSWLPLIVIVVAIITIWIATIPFAKFWTGTDNLDKTGVFGDTFGAVNALFSGLAFAGLFYAILLQRLELKAQREELEATRGVLQSQQREAEQQNKTLALQGFENTFFQLLKVHSENVNSLDLRSSEHSDKVISNGRACFRTYYGYMKNLWVNHGSGPPNDQTEVIENLYEMFYVKYEQDVGHYFRHLYHLVKFVDDSHVNNKKKYTNIIRAQLSRNELLLLFYNCLSAYGAKKFRPLVEKYALLHTLSDEELLHRDAHFVLYSDQAYDRGA